MIAGARAVVTRRLPDPVEERLAGLVDARLNPDDRPLTAGELAEAMRGADALVATVTDRLTADLLSATPRRVRIVANFGAGVDHIDLDAARRAGIVVTNTPGVLTDATADLTMALLLAVARRTGEGERRVRSGAWTGWGPTRMLGRSVTGMTLGIVGMGRIGRAVAHRATRGFGMRVLYHQRRPVDAAALAGLDVERARDLDDLLARSDAVTLHTPATPGDPAPDRRRAPRADAPGGLPHQHLPGRGGGRGRAGRRPGLGRHRRSGPRRVRARAPRPGRPAGAGERGAAAAPGKRDDRDPHRHGKPGGRQPGGVPARRSTTRTGWPDPALPVSPCCAGPRRCR